MILSFENCSHVSDILKDFELVSLGKKNTEFCNYYPQIRSDMFIKVILYCYDEMLNILLTYLLIFFQP